MKHSAFSLVELSIVLVILGLLTGGILAGQSLIRASELRTVSVDYSRYVTSVQSFRDKYMGVPGDITNATRFWGTDADGCPPTITTRAPKIPTCNGDGNGSLLNNTEVHRSWQHLANAGLIEGSYSGLPGAGGANEAVPGENAPRGRLSNSGWAFYFYTTSSGNGTYFDHTWGRNALIFGTPTATTLPYGAIMTPEEVWNVDVKLDDGKPAQGLLWVVYWNPCTLATSSADVNADYELTNNTKACSLAFNRPL